jgi:CRISPR-associated endonuclease Csn1
VLKGVEYQGYFVMYESDGRLNLRLHDQPLTSDIGYFRKSIYEVSKVEKFNIDVLGNIYPIQKEARGLA